jgi:hypothetical protein
MNDPRLLRSHVMAFETAELGSKGIRVHGISPGSAEEYSS